MKFLAKYPENIREKVLEELKAEWTYNSTAIEGNTLNLGETKQVIAGLTISGHSLAEHKEVYDHVNAIGLIEKAVEDDEFKMSLEFLNQLNASVMTKRVIDVQNPVGELKNSDNGCQHFKDGKLTWLSYSPVEITKPLILRWIYRFNNTKVNSPVEAIKAFSNLHLSFASIHPYADGNGRMIRLLANIPILKAGYPPIIISREHRNEYIECLADYGQSGGIPTSKDSELIMQGEIYNKFMKFVKKESRNVYGILRKYHSVKSTKNPNSRLKF